MKKLFTGMMITCSLAAAITFAACGQGDQNSSGGKFNELNTAESVYAFSAASAGMIISAGQNDGQTTPETTTPDVTAPDTAIPDTSAPEGTTPGQTATDDGTYLLDGYMTLIDSLLSDGGFVITETTSDRAEYESKTVISYRDINGGEHSYEMHYNKTADDCDDDDHGEEEYAITGVMVIDGTDYAIRGEREVENGRGESESETELRVDLGEGKYMLVEQSYERGDGEFEQKYNYSVYENGRLTERSTFEYEEEDGETELHMTSLKDGENHSFAFTRERVRGEEVLKLRIGGRDGQSYYVTPATDADGNTYYEYQPVAR